MYFVTYKMNIVVS